MDSGADWLLTLDQDAAPTEEIVNVAVVPSNATRALTGLPSLVRHHSKRIGLAGRAQRVEGGLGSRPAPPLRQGASSRWPPCVTSAGSSKPSFVDQVDTEYCLRARARDTESGIGGPAMTHQIGQPRAMDWLSRRSSHKPLAVRRYYMTRNRLLVWRRYCA